MAELSALIEAWHVGERELMAQAETFERGSPDYYRFMGQAQGLMVARLMAAGKPLGPAPITIWFSLAESICEVAPLAATTRETG